MRCRSKRSIAVVGSRTAAAMVVACTIAAAHHACGQSLAQWQALCEQMVEDEIVAAGVTNERVIAAMKKTPRHEFVPPGERKRAYFDMALPIGSQQTISPPFVVAYMTEQLDPQPSDKVLEIGTGSGYQAAILSPLVREVYSIEIVPELGNRAARTLRRLRYENVQTKVGDGFLGWPEAAPFDKIIVTCSPEKVPQPLIDQLAEGGQMVVPVGERYSQNLYLFRKQDGQLVSEALRGTFFVPMTGQAEANRQLLPDPKRPRIVNGDFEQLLGEQELPEGWYYLRQGKVVTNPSEARRGERYVEFEGTEPGRGSRLLQGFAVDGRQVSQLAVQFHVRGESIQHGRAVTDWPYLVVTFYDERRAGLGSEVVGPFRGSFAWQHRKAVLDVPVRAREAILRIGLLGATGKLAFDDIRLEAVE
jgi:protein-L-isoaspartate(D-aspartate) O-methyltransferase